MKYIHLSLITLFSLLLFKIASDSKEMNRVSLGNELFRKGSFIEFKKKDRPRALAFYSSACDLNIAKACLRAGMLLKDMKIRNEDASEYVNKVMCTK